MADDNGKSRDANGNPSGNGHGESLGERAKRLLTLLTRDIWVMDFSDETRQRRGAVAVLRWLYLVVHGFLRDNCLLRAAALSYTTTLSIAPFLAVAFTISKALGLQHTDTVRNLLMQLTAERTDMVDLILNYVQATDVKTLGYMGLLLLFVTALSLLSTIESAMNQIWGVSKGRSPWRKFTDFFSVTLICPLFFFIGLSVTVSLESDAFVQRILSVSAFNYVYLNILKAMPYVMIWLALAFLYAFMPNTRVRFSCALAGGVIAGTMWQIAQYTYVTYQVGIAKYNAIYGGFAQFPIFLLWLYISWVIVLLGAEISFSLQNMKSFQSEVRAGHVSFEGRMKAAILMLLLLTDAFKNARRPLTIESAANDLGVPVRTINEVMETLCAGGFAVRLHDEDEGRTFALGSDPAETRVSTVIRALSRGEGVSGRGLDFIDPRYDFVHALFADVFKGAEETPANASLEELWTEHCRTPGGHGCDWLKPSERI